MKEVFKAKKERLQFPDCTFNLHLERRYYQNDEMTQNLDSIFNQNEDCRYCQHSYGPEYTENGYMFWCQHHHDWAKDYRLGCDNFNNI